MPGNFLEMHMKLFQCGKCRKPNLNLARLAEKYTVTCQSCETQTREFDNPSSAFFDWRDNFQKSLEDDLKEVIDTFET